MSDTDEEFARLSQAIGDSAAQTVQSLGWIGPREREALVEAGRRAQKSAIKARSDDMQAKMTTSPVPNLEEMSAALDALVSSNLVASSYNPAVPTPEVDTEPVPEDAA